ncbi:MAG: META domain-containing protein [Chloroflexi bacterium]|nr:META domain-containing protein [Chloroflexota bacterium]
MRTLPLVLLAVAALVAPTAALAGGSPTPTYRAFVITGMVLGDQKAEATGKLSIDGSQLSASVGCNLIGGKVSVDGNTVTISEPLAMTEMACPGTSGDLEAMLIKILQRGPFTISSGAWSGDGAQLLVEELSVGNPGPNATAPDDPVSSSPGAVIVDPYASCPPYPFPSDPGVINGTVEPDGGPTSGGGSGSSDGSTGTGGAPAAGSDGTTGVDSGPTSTAVAEPGATATVGDEPPAPPVAPEPGQTFDIDPGFNGSPLPVDPCAERMYAVDQGNGVGGAGLIPPKADAAEHAAPSSNPNAPIVALLLVLMTVAAVSVATLRRRQARPFATIASSDGPPEDLGPTPR